MVDRMRSCAKTGCRWPAAASLSYRYATREVWVRDLEDSHPSTYDLCPHHADALVVPRGWSQVDERSEQVVVREPSAQEIVDRRVRADAAAAETVAVAAASAQRRSESTRNRYADLLVRLPELAAELTSAEPEPHAPDPLPPPPAPALPPPARPPVTLSHELAPGLPPDLGLDGSSALSSPPPGPPLSGQLALPGTEEVGRGVVVPFDRTRRRLGHPPDGVKG